MMKFFKNLFGHNEQDDLEKRRAKAYAQDKQVRESLTEKQIDKGVKDTMIASDPVTKY